MRRKGYRGVGCVKRSFSKCEGICKTYDKIQTAFAEQLRNDPSIIAFLCNALMDSGDEENQYTTDFVATKQDHTKQAYRRICEAAEGKILRRRGNLVAGTSFPAPVPVL